MRIRPLLFGLVVLVIFLAPVVVATATGTWATTGRAGAGAGGEGSGGGPGAGEGSGAGSGVVAPGEARGWMTLAQVSEANGIPVDEILAAFDLPSDTDSSTELRELESDAFSVAALRAWLAERTAP